MNDPAYGIVQRRSPRRRRHPVAVLLALCLVPAALAGGLWQIADRRAAQGEPGVVDASTTPQITAPTGTPVLSLRRAPVPVAVSAALAPLRFQLGAVAAQVQNRGCVAVGVHDRLAIAVDDRTGYIPASTMKLVLGAVALEVLDPGSRFSTEVRADRVGTVALGGVHLIGGGDPVLAAEWYPTTQRRPPLPRTPFEDLITGIVDSGMTAVDGDVVVHDDRYDDERFVATWGDGIRGTEAGPVGALLVNDGFVTGTPIKPPDPALAAGQELLNALRAAGIAVSGDVRRASPGEITPDEVVARVVSAPLDEIISEMLVTSDNTTAEMLIKELAVAAGLEPTRDNGALVVLGQLQRWELDTEGVWIVDGSGLDRGNRLHCGLVLEMLQIPGLADRLAPLMAVAGRTGTMTDLLEGTPLDGRLVAKTGSLTGVKAFSGILAEVAGVDLVFSLLLNDTAGIDCTSTDCAILDDLGRALVTYPGRLPDPSRLGPITATDAP